MQAADLLARTPKPTDPDIDRAMAGNICRCGTYQRIRAAIKTAATCGRERGHEPHRKRQPPPLPRHHALHRRLRAGGAGAARGRRWRRTPACAPARRRAPLNPSVYLGIEPDGTVFIVTHRSEMGTGIRTSLPLVAADELDADWSRVRIEQGLGDTEVRRPEHRRVALDPRLLRRVPPRRRVGARRCWSAPPPRSGACRRREITVQNHEILHPRPEQPPPGVWRAGAPPRPSCRCRRTRDLRLQAEAASGSSSARSARIYDLADITTGKAPFGLDIYREDMVCASIEHPPVVRRLGEERGRQRARWQVRACGEVVTLDPPKRPLMFQPLGGVAVIADNTWAAFKGRKALKIEWNDGAERVLRVGGVQEAAARRR